MSRPHSLWSNFLNQLVVCTVFAFYWLCMFIKNFLLSLNLFLVYLTRITTTMINWTWQDTFDLTTIILLTDYCCTALYLAIPQGSVHTSANLIFHFSNKNGKRKYYLSLSYLHILKYRKKEKKRKWSGKLIFFSFS